MVFSLRKPTSLSYRGLTAGNFSDVLQHLVGPKGFPPGPVPRTMGLAISGGVDSMALAVLCSNLKSAPPESVSQVVRDIHFQAFIVDHGARPGSIEEALRVSVVLKSIDIPTRILTIKWPEDIRPSELPNFETMARKYRFQALGRACQEMDIQHLMLAHHVDDQVESVLMRILNGHRGRGLSGIKENLPIPECYGLHGICRSGGIDSSEKSSPKTLIPGPKALHTENLAIPVPIKVEHGGIRILRPLLEYSKKDLRRTCEQFCVPWFEDATNYDFTLTPRNAIRHVLDKNSLPQALDRARLLRLADSERAYASLLDKLVYECRNLWVRIFEPRSGTIIARFTDWTLRAENLQLIPENPHLITGSLRKSQEHILQMLSLLIIRDIVESVSPSIQLDLKTFVNAGKIIFPTLYPSEEAGASNPCASDFTVAGVHFSRRAATISTESIKRKEAVPQDHEWLISRQPYFSDITKLPQLEIPSGKVGQNSFSLWDGRYWIQAKNMTRNDLLLRPFHKEDLAPFRSSLDHPEKQKFSRLLKTIAPNLIRFTLPAIADRNGKVMALPSVGINIPGAKDEVEYDIRYKEVPEYIRQEYEESYKSDSNEGLTSSIAHPLWRNDS